jgi:hypothetical protein
MKFEHFMMGLLKINSMIHKDFIEVYGGEKAAGISIPF